MGRFANIEPQPDHEGSFLEVLGVFTKLGLTSFAGLVNYCWAASLGSNKSKASAGKEAKWRRVAARLRGTLAMNKSDSQITERRQNLGHVKRRASESDLLQR